MTRISRPALVALALAASSAATGSCGNSKLHPVTKTPDGGPGNPGRPDFGLPPASDARAAETAVCAAETVPAQRSPVDLLFLVDVGPTIHNPFAGGMESKFFAGKKAIFEFVMDPQSAGIGVGLQFYPYGFIDKPCLGHRDCGYEADPVRNGVTSYSCKQTRQCALRDQPPGTWLICEDMFGAGGPCECFAYDNCSTLSRTMGRPVTCTLVGECSVSHAACAEVGKPCPGGMAGDMCQPPAGVCAQLIGTSCAQSFYDEPASRSPTSPPVPNRSSTAST